MKAERNKRLTDSVTVEGFLAAGRETLRMELTAGARGLKRRISERAIHRPGLALSGFFQHFPDRRIQLIGLAEHAYLSSFTPESRAQRLERFFQRRIPCLVVSRNLSMFPEVPQLAEQYGISVLRTRMVTKHFVNAATIIMENLTAPRMNAQGTMVEFMGIGILVEGKAGIGKSETTLALIRKGAALVSDDVTVLRRDTSGALIASPVNVTRYHMEIRGLGIIHVPSLFGVASVRGEKKLDLVATLCEPGTQDEEDRSGESKPTRELLGVQVPRVFVPVAPGRDLANLIETAALDFKLRSLGHDAAKELDEQLIRSLVRGGAGSE